VQREMVCDLLLHLDAHKSMGLDGIHSRVLRKLGEVLAKPLSITREVPQNWRMVSVTPIYKKGWNYRPVNLTSVLGKVMEQIIPSTILRHVQDNQ
ncbi:hypothetical protein N325_11690, partial [Colius striatus]